MLQIKQPNENTPSAHSSQAAGAQTNTQPPSGEYIAKHHNTHLMGRTTMISNDNLNFVLHNEEERKESLLTNDFNSGCSHCS